VNNHFLVEKKRFHNSQIMFFFVTTWSLQLLREKQKFNNLVLFDDLKKIDAIWIVRSKNQISSTSNIVLSITTQCFTKHI
jgi:hypothetical protein